MNQISAAGCAVMCASLFWLGGPAAADGPAAAAESETAWSDFAALPEDRIVFVDALIAITDKASRDLLDRPIDREDTRNRIRELAWKVRGGIIEGGPQEIAEAFRHAFFVAGGLIPDEDFGARAEAQTAVVSEVLRTRRGVCLSLSLLYLAVAEEANLPMHGVSVPTHFFVRYGREGGRLNIETLDRGGVTRTDDFYREQFLVRKGEAFYLESLTPKMTLAVYLSQLGAIYTRLGKFEPAVELLLAAQRASPRDPEVRTNLGIAWFAAGRIEDAVRAWRSAIVLNPYDDVAHYRLSSVLAERGQWLEAVYHHDEALRLGHAVDMELMRRLEPHRPDTLRLTQPVGEA